MRISLGRQTQASTLIVTVIFTGVLSLVLLSYLSMANNSNILTARSLAWNNALPIAEAGIEEAASALQSCGTKSVTTTLQTNGWTVSGNTVIKRRTLTDVYFDVLISSTNTANPIGKLNPAVIYSTGYVRAPFRLGYIGRVVKVTTKYTEVIADYAILAKSLIKMSGGWIDSFDSSDPAYSTGGAYDPLKKKANAHVGCNSWAAACIQVGNGLIYGDVNTQFGGTVTVGGGRVGDIPFVTDTANAGLIQSGHGFNNLNETFTDVTVPFTSGNSLYSAVVGGTNYLFVADSGNYYYGGDLTVPGGQAMLIRGDATVYCTGKFTTSGSGYIYIAPGGKMRLVVGGSSVTISGGGVVNGTQFAANCRIDCLPTCTKGTYSGSAAYIGTVNAPQAAWTYSGSADAYGAFTAYSFTITGGASIHYDEALGKGASGSPYSITSWAEL